MTGPKQQPVKGFDAKAVRSTRDGLPPTNAVTYAQGGTALAPCPPHVPVPSALQLILRDFPSLSHRVAACPTSLALTAVPPTACSRVSDVMERRLVDVAKTEKQLV